MTDDSVSKVPGDSGSGETGSEKIISFLLRSCTNGYTVNVLAYPWNTLSDVFGGQDPETGEKYGYYEDLGMDSYYREVIAKYSIRIALNFMNPRTDEFLDPDIEVSELGIRDDDLIKVACVPIGVA